MHFGRNGTPYRYKFEDGAYSHWQPGLNVSPLKALESDEHQLGFVPSANLPKRLKFKSVNKAPVEGRPSSETSRAISRNNRFSPLERVLVEEEPNNEVRGRARASKRTSRKDEGENPNRRHGGRYHLRSRKPRVDAVHGKANQPRIPSVQSDAGEIATKQDTPVPGNRAETDPRVEMISRRVDDLDDRVIRSHISSIEREAAMKDVFRDKVGWMQGQITTLMAQVLTKPSALRTSQLEKRADKTEDQITKLKEALVNKQKNEENANSEWASVINSLREKVRGQTEWRREVEENVADLFQSREKCDDHKEWIGRFKDAFSGEEDAPTQWRRALATMQVLKEELSDVRTRLDEQRDKG